MMRKYLELDGHVGLICYEGMLLGTNCWRGMDMVLLFGSRLVGLGVGLSEIESSWGSQLRAMVPMEDL